MHSPFVPYLFTNYAPSNHEKSQIEELLIKPRDELKAIEHELTELHERIIALTAQRDERTQFIKAHTVLLSPTRRLPADILRTIFLLCTEDTYPFPDRRDTNPMSATAAPMLLTFVCQHWRQTALDFPMLWTKPCVVVPKGICDYERRAEVLHKRAQLVRLWLSRTSKAHLTISLMSSPSQYMESAILVLIDALMDFSAQWRRLRLQASQEILKPFFTMNSSSIPNLQHVDCSLVSRSLAKMHDGRRSVLDGAEVRGVRLSGLLSVTILGLPLRWSQLTSIYIAKCAISQWSSEPIPFSDQQMIELLTRCRALERIQFYISGYDIRYTYSDNRLSLPYLTLLDIDLATNSRAVEFVSSLHLPMLDTLKIYTDLDGVSLDAIVGSFTCQIRHLTLFASNLDNGELTQILARTDQLESLELLYHQSQRLATPTPYMADALFSSLTPNTEVFKQHSGEKIRLCLCPNLQKLTIKVDANGPRRISDAAIVELVKARRETSPPTLHTVIIEQPHHSRDLDVVAELVRNGVDLASMSISLQNRTATPVLEVEAT